MSEAASYQDELVANYDKLREQREWSHAQMGEHLDNVDPSLAAEYRAKAAPAKSSTPVDRKSSRKSEA